MEHVPLIFWLVNGSGVIGGMMAVLWLATGRKRRALLYMAFGLSMLFFVIRFGAILLV